MAKSEFVQLAQVFEEKKFFPGGSFLSEKLDGFRFIWDSGITRGMAKEDVPWSNMEKDVTPNQVCTGLWTRYGNVIHAPDFFLDNLPKFMCDGELYMGRGTFQQLRSIAARLPINRSDSDWRKLWCNVFDIPSPEELFKPREIKTTQFKKTITPSCLIFAKERLKVIPKVRTFQDVYSYLKKNVTENESIRVHEQTQLPFTTAEALAIVFERLEEVVRGKGEGLILRRPGSIWTPERTWNMVKIKKFSDAEATVIGYTTGRSTDKGSKLRGLMGTLVVSFNGHVFELSGFTSAERVLTSIHKENLVEHTSLRKESTDYETTPIMVEPKAFQWAYDNPSPPNGPGTRVPDWIVNETFPLQSQVTFKYTELSDDGIPKVASYWRPA